jgi:hypothetical protein
MLNEKKLEALSTLNNMGEFDVEVLLMNEIKKGEWNANDLLGIVVSLMENAIDMFSPKNIHEKLQISNINYLRKLVQEGEFNTSIVLLYDITAEKRFASTLISMITDNLKNVTN